MLERADVSREPKDSRVPDPSLLEDFLEAGAHLFPLTAHDDGSIEPRRRGKRPWRKGWNRRDANPLTPQEAEEHMRAGRNVGDRLKATDLCIDIDPRHFGDGNDYSDPDAAETAAVAALDAWCKEHGFNDSGWPIYVTGSGGLHVRLQKPADLAIVTKLEGRPGFEFKTAGTYVVASGSVHARTGRLYAPYFLSGAALKDAPQAPAELLAMLRRPEVEASTGGGELEREQLAELLGALDPADFREHDDWFRLMASCHHATNGDGEDVFLEWSAKDPLYADDVEINRSRWHSLRTDKPGIANVATLYKAVRAAGRGDLIPVEHMWPEAEFEVGGTAPASGEACQAVIRYAEHSLPANLDAAEAALLKAGSPIYQMQGDLVRPIRLDGAAVEEDAKTEGVRRQAGALVIRRLDPHRTLELMLEAARFVKFNATKQEWLPGAPPLRFARHFHARAGEWRLRTLRGIIEAPTLRPDGSVLETPGYDPATGLILDTNGVAFPTIPDTPSRAQALEALAVIKSEVLSGFPFVVDDPVLDLSAARSVALSAILTACVRKSLRTAPMHAFTAPAMGTGKTLLANCVSMIALGRSAAAMSQGRTEEEDEKRLFSILRQGDPVILVDNIERPVQGDALCTILTEDYWQCRVLGVSENQMVATNALFMATGNNLEFMGDITTRVIMCRLDAQMEAPEKRTFSVDLRKHVPTLRPRLVAAALTTLRAFIVAGRPGLAKLEPFGRFEEWSDLIRGALVWLGEADPCETRGFISAQDSKREQLAALLNAWEAAIGFGTWHTAKEIIDLADRRDVDGLGDSRLKVALEAILPRWVTPRGLGAYLGKAKDRIVGGRCIRQQTSAGESSRYALMRVDPD